MKFLSLKFNVRRVLIAIVVMALLVVLEVGRRKRAVLLEKAEKYGISETAYLTLANLVESNPSDNPSLVKAAPKRSGAASKPGGAISKEEIEKRDAVAAEAAKSAETAPVDRKAQAAGYREKAAVQAGIRQYYERAALFPWLPVARHPAEPDPAGTPRRR